MAWRMLLRRVPTRSLTIVGDVAQTAAAGGAHSWAAALDPVLRGSWRLAELTVNYRTPAEVADAATQVARTAGLPLSTLTSARHVEGSLRIRVGDPLTEVVDAARAALAALPRRRQRAGGGDRAAADRVAAYQSALRATDLAGLLPGDSQRAGRAARGAGAAGHEGAGVRRRRAGRSPPRWRPADLYVAMTRPDPVAGPGHGRAAAGRAAAAGLTRGLSAGRPPARAARARHGRPVRSRPASTSSGTSARSGRRRGRAPPRAPSSCRTTAGPRPGRPPAIIAPRSSESSTRRPAASHSPDPSAPGTAAEPPMPATSPASAGTSGAVDHAMSTGAQPVPYRSGWIRGRSNEGASSVVPMYSNARPVSATEAGPPRRSPARRRRAVRRRPAPRNAPAGTGRSRPGHRRRRCSGRHSCPCSSRARPGAHARSQVPDEAPPSPSPATSISTRGRNSAAMSPGLRRSRPCARGRRTSATSAITAITSGSRQQRAPTRRAHRPSLPGVPRLLVVRSGTHRTIFATARGTPPRAGRANASARRSRFGPRRSAGHHGPVLSALLLENLHPLATTLLRSDGVEVTARTGAMDEEELSRSLERRPAARHPVQDPGHPRGCSRRHPTSLAIGAFCIGTNQIDLAAAAERGVAVFNAPFSNTRSVVELAVAEIIALTRRLTERDKALHAGVWDKSADGAHEVRGRDAGHRRLREHRHPAVGARRVARACPWCSTTRPSDSRWATPAGWPPWTSLLEVADVVTLHVDGRPATPACSARSSSSRCGPASLFLNLSRGFVVDYAALREAIIVRPGRRRGRRRVPRGAQAARRPVRPPTCAACPT